MNWESLGTAMISPLAVAIVGWVIKRTIENAITRWTDRIEKAEKDIIEERGKREALGMAVAAEFKAAHAELDDVRENKMDREEAMREMGRIRQTLERLTEGQAEIKGRLDAEAARSGKGDHGRG